MSHKSVSAQEVCEVLPPHNFGVRDLCPNRVSYDSHDEGYESAWDPNTVCSMFKQSFFCSFMSQSRLIKLWTKYAHVFGCMVTVVCGLFDGNFQFTGGFDWNTACDTIFQRSCSKTEREAVLKQSVAGNGCTGVREIVLAAKGFYEKNAFYRRKGSLWKRCCVEECVLQLWAFRCSGARLTEAVLL